MFPTLYHFLRDTLGIEIAFLEIGWNSNNKAIINEAEFIERFTNLTKNFMDKIEIGTLYKMQILVFEGRIHVFRDGKQVGYGNRHCAGRR